VPRTRNKKKSVPLKITTSEEVMAYLEQLVAGGLYGPTAPEVAGVLIGMQIQHFIDSGYLEKSRRKGS
jgi:hypothetical protein